MSANNLSVKQITIDDSIDQIATSCTLSLVDQMQQPASIAEFSLPGDSEQVVATSIRPNGAQIGVNVSFGENPNHEIFRGVVEYVDDLEDPDQFQYKMALSNVPPGEPQRTTVTQVFNYTLAASYPTSTVHNILSRVCAAAGLTFGRCDLPDYTINGTYEIVDQNPVEVAQEMCAPFNTYPFQKYFVRVDQNGLQIIKIDYTQGAEVSNVYEISDLKMRKRHFEKYMPDHRIGRHDVVLTGADIYATKVSVSERIVAYQNYETTTKDLIPQYDFQEYKPVAGPGGSVYYVAADGTIIPGDESNPPGRLVPTGGANSKWTETSTNIQFIVDISTLNGQYPVFSSAPLLDDLISMVSTGQLTGLSLVESNVLYSEQREYDSVSGLTKKTTTTFAYDRIAFPDHRYFEQKNYKTVLMYEESVVTAYAKSLVFPISLARKYYGYNNEGILLSTSTLTYMNFHGQGWTLVDTQIETNSDVSISNAEIQYAIQARMRQPNIPLPVPTVERPGESSLQFEKTQIGRFQLINGKPFLLSNPELIYFLTLKLEGIKFDSNLNRDLNSIVSGSDFQNVLNNKQLFNQLLFDLEEQIAVQINGPHMNYEGLYLLVPMVARQRELEAAGAYWDVLEATFPFDSTPVIGESLVVGGVGGIVESVMHDIDADSAVTHVTLRRLIIPVHVPQPALPPPPPFQINP